MIGIIVLSVLASYVVLTICLLIVGGEADHRKEAIFTDRLANGRDDVAHSSIYICNAGTYVLDANSASGRLSYKKVAEWGKQSFSG